MHSNLCPERCSFTHPPFLPREEAQFPMGPPHQGPPRARKNYGLRRIPGTNWFGDAVFAAGVSMPMPPLCAPRTLVADVVPRKVAKCAAQRDVCHLGARKRGGIGGVPTVKRFLHPGEGQHVALVSVA